MKGLFDPSLLLFKKRKIFLNERMQATTTATTTPPIGKLFLRLRKDGDELVMSNLAHDWNVNYNFKHDMDKQNHSK
jgi:hypothetical protein